MQSCSFEIKAIMKDSCDEYLLSKISSIHQETLQGGFLSSLGSSFLKKIYRELANDPNSHLICAMHNEVIVGFICGTTNTSSFYKRFLQRNLVSGIIFLLPKLSSARVLKKLVETLVIPSRTKKIALPSAQLLNFCISNQYQGKGLGKLLFNALMSWFQSNDINEVTIITGQEQKAAQHFYHKQGLEQKNTVSIHDDNESVVYIWEPTSNRHISL